MALLFYLRRKGVKVMRMQDMNTYLETKGFKVERKHERIDGKSYYNFTIEKDGRSLKEKFEYPAADNTQLKNYKQEEFLDRMLRTWNACFNKAQNRNDAMIAFAEGIRLLNPKEAEFVTYCENDVKNTMELYKFMNNNYIRRVLPEIKNVIFNYPATIVFWTDGTKTVVKCQDGDEFDPEKGLAMAISKKALGNKRNYYHQFLHWLKKYEKNNIIIKQEVLKFVSPNTGIFTSAIEQTAKAFDQLKITIRDMNRKNNIKKAYDIMIKYRDEDKDFNLDEVIGYLGEALEDRKYE